MSDFSGKHSFEDMLETSPLRYGALEVDTQVDVVVTRIREGVFEIDSSTFGEKDVRILTEGHNVLVSKEGNGKFFRELAKLVDARALALASELPETAWTNVSTKNDV